MLLNGFDHPVFPEGWCITTRDDADLPGMLIRLSDLDSNDETKPQYIPGQPSPGPFSHVGEA